MKKLTNILVLGLVVLLIGMVFVPAAAQEDVPGPGEGEPIIYPNLGDDIKTLNPIVSSDGSSNDVIAQIFPTFIGVDYTTYSYEPDQPGALATGWEVSEDGLAYTVTLRDDVFWSDGTPVTANDIVYSFDAIASGETDTTLGYVLTDIASVTAVDDYTLEITLNNASCDAFGNVVALPVVPAHVYSSVFAEFGDMNESDFNLSDPGASAEAWTFGNFRPGEQVTLLADPTYTDAPNTGYTVPAGWVYKNVANQDLIVEQFLSGDLSLIASVPGSREEEIISLGDEGEINVGFAPASTVRFIALNGGNPENPQAAWEDLDEDGIYDPDEEELIEQEPHPILSDVRVRQALMFGMDWEALDIGAFGGGDVQLASHWLPTHWSYDEETVPFYPFDLEQARTLLTEAGWIDDDGDEGTAASPTPRVAQGVETVEDGTTLAFELITNAGNVENESTGILLTDQWAQIGVDLDFQPVDFNILVDELLAQTYDAVMVFWGIGNIAFPDQDIRVTFGPENDNPGGGFNTSSFYSERMMELLVQANDPAQTDGCNIDARIPLYQEAYQILRDEVAWIWLGTSTVYSAISNNIENFTTVTGPGYRRITDQSAGWVIFED